MSRQHRAAKAARHPRPAPRGEVSRDAQAPHQRDQHRRHDETDEDARAHGEVEGTHDQTRAPEVEQGECPDEQCREQERQTEATPTGGQQPGPGDEGAQCGEAEEPSRALVLVRAVLVDVAVDVAVVIAVVIAVVAGVVAGVVVEVVLEGIVTGGHGDIMPVDPWGSLRLSRTRRRILPGARVA
jgi:hypothetical protein